MTTDADAPSLWRPLRVPVFRNLLMADVLSDVGTFMQSVGAAWLMVSLGAGPMLVALTQTASTAPFFVFALPAGSIGDIVDRRRLILFTETWMVAIAAILTIAAFAGVMTPWLLLGLTFALSAGDAIETPTWRALLPELVGKADLAAASALNGIEFNIARAVGPALAGIIIASAGVDVAFLVNTCSFVGVILVIARWQRHVRARTGPPETISGATIAAVRYVRYAPELNVVMLRTALTMFAASGLLALLPVLAHDIGSSPVVYGVLLGCFGIGAIGGALAMQPARRRWPVEAVVSGAVVTLGLLIAASGAIRSVPLLAIVMLLAGAPWIVVISLISTLVQGLAPEWARARILAIFMLTTQGGLAAGSAFWGTVAAHAGVPAALMWAGLGTVATVALTFVARLPDGATDVSPWNHWRMPAVIRDSGSLLDRGPVLVSVEYHVEEAHGKSFLQAMQKYGRVRRRDGAFRWDVYRDLERADVYVETFVVSSWAEHLRQHERFTHADRAIEEEIAKYSRGEPAVRHFIHARG